MLHMESIGIRELRQNASEYLRRVAEGDSIEITDRGRPVARLVPIHRDGYDQLMAEGLIRRGTGNLLDIKPVPLPKGATPPSKILEDLRADER